MARTPSGARAIFVISGLAFVLGNCGAMRSCTMLSPRASAPPASALPGFAGNHTTEAELAAYTTFAVEFNDTVFKPAHRRVASAAELAFALLLVVASAMLALGRPNAVWWVSQAALANIAWTIGDGVSVGAALSAGHALDRAYLAYVQATGQLPAETVAELGRGGPGFTGVALSVYLMGALVSVFFYAFIFWRVRRPDVAKALTVTPEP